MHCIIVANSALKYLGAHTWIKLIFGYYSILWKIIFKEISLFKLINIFQSLLSKSLNHLKCRIMSRKVISPTPKLRITLKLPAVWIPAETSKWRLSIFHIVQKTKVNYLAIFNIQFYNCVCNYWVLLDKFCVFSSDFVFYVVRASWYLSWHGGPIKEGMMGMSLPFYVEHPDSMQYYQSKSQVGIHKNLNIIKVALYIIGFSLQNIRGNNQGVEFMELS